MGSCCKRSYKWKWFVMRAIRSHFKRNFFMKLTEDMQKSEKIIRFLKQRITAILATHNMVKLMRHPCSPCSSHSLRPLKNVCSIYDYNPIHLCRSTSTLRQNSKKRLPRVRHLLGIASQPLYIKGWEAIWAHFTRVSMSDAGYVGFLEADPTPTATKFWRCFKVSFACW